MMKRNVRTYELGKAQQSDRYTRATVLHIIKVIKEVKPKGKSKIL